MGGFFLFAGKAPSCGRRVGADVGVFVAAFGTWAFADGAATLAEREAGVGVVAASNPVTIRRPSAAITAFNAVAKIATQNQNTPFCTLGV